MNKVVVGMALFLHVTSAWAAAEAVEHKSNYLIELASRAYRFICGESESDADAIPVEDIPMQALVSYRGTTQVPKHLSFKEWLRWHPEDRCPEYYNSSVLVRRGIGFKRVTLGEVRSNETALDDYLVYRGDASSVRDDNDLYACFCGLNGDL